MEKIIQLQDLQPGASYLVRARAINRYGVVSEWSQTYKLNVSTDDSPPSTPSAPVVEIAGPQKIVVSHNNKTTDNKDLEYDVVSYKVFQNTTSSNTGGTLIHTMSATRPGSGLSSFATINVDVKDTDPSATRYFYVTAVDAAGNESLPSPVATGVSITFFESAYISTLTADKIRTGTLQANQQISVGTVSPIIIKSNDTSPRGQIYIGTGQFANVNTAFYVDSLGKFSLKDALTWDGETLTIDGYFKVGDSETTISGNQVRTGHLVSNNYKRIDPALDTGANDLNGTPNDGDPDVQPTGTPLYTYDGTWIDLDDGTIFSKNFYIDNQGSAVFRGNIFGSRGIFNGELPASEIPGLTNPEGARVPTVIIESTNSDDGYLVFFKNVSTDAGMEFYVKQGDGTNWRRGSLAHLDDVAGGFLRLGAFPSSTGITPGRIRIFAESTPDGKQGEIYLDARRTFAQKIFLTQPSTTGDWANDPVTNFWKDPDGVSNAQDYFKVGSELGSAVRVRKDAQGVDKVIIKDYEIEGEAVFAPAAKHSFGGILIGRDIDGSKDGIKLDANNYWYRSNSNPESQPDFKIGNGTKELEFNTTSGLLKISGGDISLTGGGSFKTSDSNTRVEMDSNGISGYVGGTRTFWIDAATGDSSFEGTTNPTGGEIKGLLVIKNVSDQLTFKIGKNVESTRDGILLNSNNYWTISQTGLTANFKVGGATRYLEWTGSQLNISTDTVLIGGINAATTTYADTAAGNAASSISVVQKWNNEVTGVTLDSLGAIRSAGKTYNSATQGWILEYNSGVPRFEIGSTSSTYMRWTGSALEIKGEVIGGSVIDPGVTIPGGSFASSPLYGSGMGFNGNKLFLTDGYGGGIVAFSNGSSIAYGSIGPSNGTKFSGLEGGNGIIIGMPGYPSIEIGKDPSGNNKILMYSALDVGLELRPSSFILRGGPGSRIRRIGVTDTVPAGKRILYGNDVSSTNDELIWGPVPSGGGGASVPTGTITMYGGATAPSGWLFCDGSSYSTSTYNSLFNVIGYSYGGSGSLFSVPNFNGRFPRQGSNRDTGRGVTGGQDSYTLTESNIPSHTHGPGTLATNNAGSHSHGPGTLSTNNAGSHSHGPGTLSTNNAGAHTDTNTTYTFGTASNTNTNNGTANRLTNSTSSNSNNSISSHSHTVNAGTTGTESSHSHTVNAGTTGTESSHSHTVNSGSTGSWGSATPSQIDNRPEFLQVNFIIKT